jgi:NAD(P)-dependent dehydrogenase (short-subunit alcohol dehydrogenase family)
VWDVRYLITGASRGIGRCLLESMLADGHEVFAIVRPGTKIDRLGADQLVEADLSAPATLADAVADLAGSVGRLDGFVHSAGIARGARLPDATVADFEALFAVNVTAAAEIVKAFLPALRAARGTVVLVNSTSGLSAGPPLSAYGSSKYALRGFADALRSEEPGIRVTSIYPSRTATDMQRELRALERADYIPDDYLRPETVASLIITALTVPPDAVITDLTVRPS